MTRDRTPVNDGDIRLVGWPCPHCGARRVVVHFCGGTGGECWVGREPGSSDHGEYYCHACETEWGVVVPYASLAAAPRDDGGAGEEGG